MSKFNRTNYRLVVRNMSTLVSDEQAAIMTAAVSRQVLEDIGPSWGLRAKIEFIGKAAVPSGVMRIDIEDTAPDQFTLGYHWLEDGLPVTHLFAQDEMDSTGFGGVSATLSHEVIEMLIDPGVNLYAIGPDPSSKKSALFPYEACDPVQGTPYMTKVLGVDVPVSNFVFPEWFEAQRTAGERFDQAKVLTAPFSLAPQGYATIMDERGTWVDRWGAKRETAPRRHRSAARAAKISTGGPDA